MSLNLAPQHTPKKAEPRPVKDSLFRRQSNIWSGETPAHNKHDDNGLDSHDNPHLQTGAKSMEEEAVARLKDVATGGDVLKKSGLSRPVVITEGDGRMDQLEPQSAQSITPKTQKGIRTRQVQSIAPPFPKRAELRVQTGSSKQRKHPTDQEIPVKANGRRLSSTRHSRSPPSVARADSLERSPWSGQRPEDRLTDLTIKNGYCEKAPVHNEANTAKPSLWPHLKNGSGIHSLSLLFAAVLQRKEENGRVIASSTFKPPPRVTLTDTKREAWIRDLADPEVPLRRLSRTIPHGIRGKLLLDQCLAKQIPMTRAVWLARCVGANELRAFRRKGVSGAVMVDNEIRWTKEWTGIVEAFNHECIEVRPGGDWKSRVTYAMQLTARFFTCGLLDREHFFDWLLNNIESYSWEIFPVSLFTARNYWRELASTLKYGRRLALACCTRLSDIIKLSHRNLFEPITNRLEQFIREMVMSNPSCMVIPTAWFEIKHLFESHLRKSDETINLAMRKITERNLRFSQPARPKSASELKGAMAIVAILDSITSPICYDVLSSTCLSRCPDPQMLITTTIQWAASPYRSERHNIYLAAGLLRTWMQQGVPVGDYTLHALSMARTSHGLSFTSLGHLIGELVRSKQFDAGRYLRWLIANGALNGCSILDKHPSCDIEILLAMPYHNLAPNFVNLRRMLLRGAGMKTDNSSYALDTVKQMINQLVSSLSLQPQSYESEWSSELYVALMSLRMAEKYALGELVRLRILSLLSTLDLTAVSAMNNSPLTNASTMSQLALYQGILETLGDFWSLNSVFQYFVAIADTTMLTAMASTVARHTEAFDAVAPGQSLWNGIQQRYQAIRLTSPPLKCIALPLLQIAMRMTEDKRILQHLEAEISMSDASLTMAAYTPVSDIQLDASQPLHGDFEDSIEQLVANATTVDARIIARVFDAIVGRVRQSAKTSRSDFLVIKPFVARLRSYDEKSFDNLASEWVIARLEDTDPNNLAGMVCILSDTGCVMLDHVVQQVDEYCDVIAKPNGSKAQTLSIRFLAMLLPRSRINESVEIDWVQIWRDHSRVMLRCLHRAICLPMISARDITRTLLQNVLSSQVLLMTINRLLLVAPTMVYQELDPSMLLIKDSTLSNLKTLVSRIIDPLDQLDISTATVEGVIHTLFASVNGFSLPSFQFGLRVLSFTPNTDQVNIMGVILDAAKVAMSKDCVLSAKLISVLDGNLTKEIRIFAESAILQDCFQSVAKPSDEYSLIQPDKEALEKYLDVVEGTISSIPEGGELGINHKIVKGLGLVLQGIKDRSHISGNGATPWEPLQLWVQVLLRLSLMHVRSFGPGDARIPFLCVLCNLLVLRNSALNPEMREFIFDVAGYFSSDLSTRDLAALQEALGDLAQYPLMRFLFGFRPPANSWLHLYSSSPSSSNAGPELQQPQTTVGPRASTQPQPPSTTFPLRQWELLPDSTPNIGVNDTALSLRLFDARKI